MNPQDKDQDMTFQTAAYNPFPEPQTIPSGWDVSEFTSTSLTDFETVEDDSTENQFV